MKARILSNLTAVLIVFLLAAGSALAVPSSPPQEDGYELSSSMDYWTIEDLGSSESNFEIIVENAAYESGFGLYTVQDVANPSNPEEFLVFNKGAEENAEKKITFKIDDSGDWYITDDPAPDNTSWTRFGPMFGFYYGVDAGNDNYGDNQDPYDYTFYTDSRLNQDDNFTEHIYTGYDSTNKNAKVYLEDLLADNADWDWEDMTVKVNNVSPQPVPEPATMLMFGIGLVGFAFITRRSLGFNKQ